MSKTFLKIIIYYAALTILILLYMVFIGVFWPQLLPDSWAPQLLLNTAINISLTLTGPQVPISILLVASFFNSTHRWGIGPSVMGFLSLWLLILMLKKNTFILTRGGMIFMILLAYLIFFFGFSLGGWWAHKKWLLNSLLPMLPTFITTTLVWPWQKKFETWFLKIVLKQNDFSEIRF